MTATHPDASSDLMSCSQVKNRTSVKHADCTYGCSCRKRSRFILRKANSVGGDRTGRQRNLRGTDERPKHSGSSAPKEVGLAVDSLLEGDGSNQGHGAARPPASAMSDAGDPVRAETGGDMTPFRTTQTFGNASASSKTRLD